MLEIFQKGGPLMWLILVCSIGALGGFLERVLLYHRSTIPVGDFLRGLANLIDRGHFSEAVEECATTPGPVARVAHAVLLKYRCEPAELRAIATEAARLEVPRIERNLPLVATAAYAAPLLGLLGTVLGLLQTFSAIAAQGGYATTADIAAGVYQSLITSAAGLSVALAAFCGCSYLSARADGFLRDMERAGIEVVQMLLNSKKREAALRRDEG